MSINIDHTTDTVTSSGTDINLNGNVVPNAITLPANSSSNIAHWVMDTSLAIAGYWSKIATLNLGSLNNADIALVLNVTAGSGSDLTTAQLEIITKQISIIDTSQSSVKFASINNRNSLRPYGVMLTATSTALGTDIDVWLNSNIAAIWRITEIASIVNGNAATPITYYNNSTWTAVTPTGTFTVTSNMAYDFVPKTLLHNFISGLTFSPNSGTPLTTIDINAGTCMDSTNTQMLDGTTMSKLITSTWAVGSGNGGLDTGTVTATTEYYIHAILKDSDDSVDYLFSLSRTAPTMPTGYTLFRNIGWIMTDISANIISFITSETSGGGIKYYWSTPIEDVNISNTLTTTARLDTLSVPSGVKVFPHATVQTYDATAIVRHIVTDPDTADVTPTVDVFTIAAETGAIGISPILCMTNTSRQIRSRASITVDTYRIITVGFEWNRR